MSAPGLPLRLPRSPSPPRSRRECKRECCRPILGPLLPRREMVTAPAHQNMPAANPRGSASLSSAGKSQPTPGNERNWSRLWSARWRGREPRGGRPQTKPNRHRPDEPARSIGRTTVHPYRLRRAALRVAATGRGHHWPTRRHVEDRPTGACHREKGRLSTFRQKRTPRRPRGNLSHRGISDSGAAARTLSLVLGLYRQRTTEHGNSVTSTNRKYKSLINSAPQFGKAVN